VIHLRAPTTWSATAAALLRPSKLIDLLGKAIAPQQSTKNRATAPEKSHGTAFSIVLWRTAG
jgi:hypothetical protein